MTAAELIRRLRTDVPLDAEVVVLADGAVSIESVADVQLEDGKAILLCES